MDGWMGVLPYDLTTLFVQTVFTFVHVLLHIFTIFMM